MTTPPPEELLELEWNRLDLSAKEEALRLAHDFYYNPKYSPVIPASGAATSYPVYPIPSNQTVRTFEVLAMAREYYAYLKPNRSLKPGF